MKTPQLIYVVEDSDIIREVVSLMFSNKDGFTVRSYRTGEEMFSGSNDETPHLLILDYYLNTSNKNAMTGYDILQRLWNENRKANTIILSGIHDNSKLDQIKKLGVIDFIDKDTDDVFEKIDHLSSKYLKAS